MRVNVGVSAVSCCVWKNVRYHSMYFPISERINLFQSVQQHFRASFERRFLWQIIIDRVLLKIPFEGISTFISSSSWRYYYFPWKTNPIKSDVVTKKVTLLQGCDCCDGRNRNVIKISTAPGTGHLQTQRNVRDHAFSSLSLIHQSLVSCRRRSYRQHTNTRSWSHSKTTCGFTNDWTTKKESNLLFWFSISSRLGRPFSHATCTDFNAYPRYCL